MGVSLVAVILLGLSGLLQAVPKLPEENMDALQIIDYNGYKGMEYKVTTSDGYILRVQRIPYGKAGPGKGPRPVIFLQHGLLCASTNWITNLPSKAAGFVFADAGFDVWLGNFRGNTYGEQNTHISNKEKAFWQFTWDEMAKYDLDAMINFALKTTGAAKLHYVGHSEGTMTAFAKFSYDQVLAAKIAGFYALAPVASVGYIGGALSYLAPFTNELAFIFNLVGYNDFAPNDWIMKLLAKYFCPYKLTDPICANVLFLIAGANCKHLNQTRIPVYLSHTPAGTSSLNVVHFGQGVKTKDFQAFDWGSANKNYDHYGQATPPIYDVKNIHVPTYLFWGAADVLGDPKDIQKTLLPYLPNIGASCEFKEYNHLDFIWGDSTAHDIYTPIANHILKGTKLC